MNRMVESMNRGLKRRLNESYDDKETMIAMLDDFANSYSYIRDHWYEFQDVLDNTAWDDFGNCSYPFFKNSFDELMIDSWAYDAKSALKNQDFNESLKESMHPWTATDIVRDLYNKYPKVYFLDERDVSDDKVALFFKFGGDVTGLEDLVKSYGCDYRISNGKLRIIADEDDDYLDEN